MSDEDWTMNMASIGFDEQGTEAYNAYMELVKERFTNPLAFIENMAAEMRQFTIVMQSLTHSYLAEGGDPQQLLNVTAYLGRAIGESAVLLALGHEPDGMQYSLEQGDEE